MFFFDRHRWWCFFDGLGLWCGRFRRLLRRRLDGFRRFDGLCVLLLLDRLVGRFDIADFADRQQLDGHDERRGVRPWRQQHGQADERHQHQQQVQQGRVTQTAMFNQRHFISERFRVYLCDGIPD